MTFLAPLFLLGAAAGALLVVALHFIVTRDPRALPFPTARFAPERPPLARARALRLEDLLLLFLRVGVVAAVGVALAGPVVRPPRRAMARVLLLDRSRAVGRADEVVDSARALLGSRDGLVLFDSAATVVPADQSSLGGLAVTPRRGRLSAALIASLRVASSLRNAADSVEIALVSPLAAEEMDRATDSIRALWPGRLRLVRVSGRTPAPAAAALVVDADTDDPLRMALPARIPEVPVRAGAAAASAGAGRAGRGRPGSTGAEPGDTIRLVRGSLGAADSAWVRPDGRLLVHWPAQAGPAPVVSGAWAPRPVPDTTGAVVAGDAVVVAPFVRRLRFRDAQESAHQHVVARWVDGTPAAVDDPIGAGCIRTVTIPVTARGDLVLQPRFARLVRALLAPCRGTPDFTPIDEPQLASLAGQPHDYPVAAADIVPTQTTSSPLAKWFLALAALLALGEWLVRRRVARGPAG
jgi:Aerotolerance regulator N-terminal